MVRLAPMIGLWSGVQPSTPLHVRISSASRNAGSNAQASRITARVVSTDGWPNSPSPRPRPPPITQLPRATWRAYTPPPYTPRLCAMNGGSGSVTHMFG